MRRVVRRGPNQPEDGAEKTFATDENTRFLVDGEVGKLEDLKPDMQVTVTAPPQDGRPAEVVTGQSRGLNGVVVRVEGASVILRMLGREERGKEVTVMTDDQTKVIYVAGMAGTPKAPTVSDLQPDMMVSVIPTTGVAQKVIVLTRTLTRPQP